MTKPKARKVYRYVNKLVERCQFCKGTGYSAYLGQECLVCDGSGGDWKRVKELVRVEVTE